MLEEEPNLPYALEEFDVSSVPRPKTRGDCLPGGCNEERPCPFVACKHHLHLEVDGITLKTNRIGVDVASMAESCALDVADRGGVELSEIAQSFGMSRQRVQQIVEKALRWAEEKIDLEKTVLRD